MSGALEGIRVLDLTRVLAGPLCTMILGDLGAEIIKVEPPQGDETRGWGPPHVGGEAAYYLGVNRNKRGIVLDFSTDDGRADLARLIAQCDVVVENYKNGTLEKWGFDETFFKEKAPRAIRCSITGYGKVGPKADLPGYDFVLQAETGLMSITGAVDGEPTKHGVAIVDITTGLYAAIAVLGALNARHATGVGQAVSVSLYQTGLSLLANVASNHLASGAEPGRYGNGHPNIVPYRTFPTRDGALALAIGNDVQFARFCNLTGRPEWASNAQMATNAARIRNRAMVDAAVGALIAENDTQHWIEILREVGIPCGAVNTVPMAIADAQTHALNMLWSLSHPVAGIIQTLATPIDMSATPLTGTQAPPLLNEHADQIRREFGLSQHHQPAAS